MSVTSITTDLAFITSIEQMQTVQYEEPKYIISGLLRTGRRRISILGGQPQVGKSSLAMFIAVCVAKGICFFDRPTTRGGVLFWQCEEDLQDVRESFRKLGYDPLVDAPIYVLNDADKNTLENLDKALEAHPDVVLVIIETLDDLLKTSDIKENSDVRRSFEHFDKVVLSKHYNRAAFLALHHLKKRETDDRGQMLLGASVLRGKSDTVIYLERPNSDSEQRLIHATVRRGTPIQKTFLEYDSETGISRLGQPYAAFKASQASQTSDRLERDILGFFEMHPDASETDCLPCVSGNSGAKRAALQRLLRNGRLAKLGKGTRGNGFKYRIADLPAAVTAQFGEVVQ